MQNISYTTPEVTRVQTVTDMEFGGKSGDSIVSMACSMHSKSRAQSGLVLISGTELHLDVGVIISGCPDDMASGVRVINMTSRSLSGRPFWQQFSVQVSRIVQVSE